jgi:tetratricopeptide (TPR) repeat protein
MSPRRLLLAGTAAALALSVATSAPALADRLHLDSGRAIDTSSWWIEGDWLMYESADGTIGIPRSAVVKIDAGGEPSSPSGWNAPAGPVSTSGGQTDVGADPDRVRELLEQGKDALDAREFERASSSFLELVNVAPHLHTARVGYAVAEIALGRDGLALSVIQDGLAEEPDQPELLELLGDLRNREERVEDALQSWRRAFELKPGDRLREKILQAERELHANRDYDFAASSHFNLRYDGNVDLGLASAMMDYLEEQYWILSDLYHHSPPQPITVQLYPKREFRDVTRAPEWVGGLYDGKIRVPLGGLNRLDPRARGVLRHELAHAVIHSKTRGNCPRWLHEGLAQIAEGKPLRDADQETIAATLARIEPSEWERRGFSYPMALSLTRYIERRQGIEGLVYVLQHLGEGQPLDDALRSVYGQSHAELCADWARAMGEDRKR